MKGTVAKDLDLNLDQKPFLSEDETLVLDSDSVASAKAAVGINLNEANSCRPSEKEHKTSEGAENGFISLMSVQGGVKPPGPVVEPPRVHEVNVGMGSDLNEISLEVSESSISSEVIRAKETRIGVSVVSGSAKFGDVVNGSSMFGDVVNGSSTFGVVNGAVNLDGLSGAHGDVNPIDKPKVSPIEESFDHLGNVSPVKNSNVSSLHETQSSIHNPTSMQEIDNSREIPSPLDTQMERCTVGSASLQSMTNVAQTQMGKDVQGSGLAQSKTTLDSEKLPVELTYEAKASSPNCMPKEHNFSVGDLVWSKVKYHPWWPGRIFDPSEASKSARQRKKKDRLLVANFGDQTFAWCEVSHLKPIQENFAELAKQSTGKAFCEAVDKVLDELARREQFGLTCSCLSGKTHSTLENNTISSSGLHEGAVVDNHRDITLADTAFDPRKLLTYVRELAESPFTNNTLEITMLRAQVVCFYAAQRHLAFGEPSSEVLLKLGSVSKSVPISKSPSLTPRDIKSKDVSPSSNKRQSLKNKKRLFEDFQGYEASEQDELPFKNTTETPKRAQKEEEGWSGRKLSQSTTKKERRNEYIFASGGYRKGSKGQQGKKNMQFDSSIHGNADGDTKKIPKAFKIGECIRKIASQLTGSPPIIKSIDPTDDKTAEKDRKKAKINSKEHILRPVREDCSVKELLSELFLVAQNPIYFLEENDIVSRVTSFFLKFRDEVFERDSVYPSYRRPSKNSSKLTVSPSTDDSDDSIWTNKTIASRPKGNRVRRKRKSELQTEESGQKPNRRIRSPNSTPSKKVKKLKDHIRSPDPTLSKEHLLSPANNLMDSPQESPTALFMKFPPGFALPSESELKEMFFHYGQISETKFFSDSGCAQVIFRRCSDAEVAFHGATANKVFGPATVSFRLRYLSSRKNIEMTQVEDPREDETNISPEDRNTSRNVEEVKKTDSQPHVFGDFVAEDIGASNLNPVEKLPISKNQ